MREWFKRLRLIVLLLALILLAIIVFQNLEQITVHLLVYTMKLPQAAVLSFTLAVGFLLGLSAPAIWRLQSRRSQTSVPTRPSAGVSSDVADGQTSLPTKQNFRRKSGVD